MRDKDFQHGDDQAPDYEGLERVLQREAEKLGLSRDNIAVESNTGPRMQYGARVDGDGNIQELRPLREFADTFGLIRTSATNTAVAIQNVKGILNRRKLEKLEQERAAYLRTVRERLRQELTEDELEATGLNLPEGHSFWEDREDWL